MPSITLIAEKLGVSIASVSRAMRGLPGVSEKTRARILALAEEYGYHPNRLMQGVVTGKSRMIGFLMPGGESPYYSGILTGVLDEFTTHNYQVVVLQSHRQRAEALRALHTFIDLRVEGVLIGNTGDEPLPADIFFALWSHNIVTIVIDPVMTEIPIDTVGSDDRRVAELIVDHLLELGHRRVAYVGPESPAQAGYARTEHTRAALRQHGLSTDYFRGINIHDPASVSEAFNSLRRGVAPPTAIIGHSDIVTVLLLQQALRAGMRVPKDLSFVGVGNQEIARMNSLPLTTVDTHSPEIGRLASEHLLARITEGKPRQHEKPAMLTVPPTLVKRLSCGLCPKG